jgi:hypothetical protein
MDTDILTSMYAQIVGGLPKEKSTLVTDQDSSDTWDEVAAEVAAAPKGTTWEMVNEIP